MCEAVNIFLTQVALHKGLPFETKIPKEELELLESLENGK